MDFGLAIAEFGSGAPLVFMPGLHGRWEYSRPAVDALAQHFRVIAFSLGDEPSSGWAFNRARGFNSFGDHVIAAMNAKDMETAVLCGQSFGGLVALNVASRFPERVRAIVLASTPGPGFHLRRRHEIYAKLPWIFGPVFALETPFRAAPELKSALPAASDRRAFARNLMKTALTAPVSVARIATRAKSIASYDIPTVCAGVTAPTLVITGEPDLDFVVDVNGTSQYTGLIAGARHVILERTGHQGTLTRPGAFAELVRAFANGTQHAAA